VIYVTGAISLTVEGLHITGGDATGLGGGPGGFDAGGGIYVRRATVILRDNGIYSNTASMAAQGYGGGMFLHQGNATISGNTVQGNVASVADLGEGGGLGIVFSTATLDGNLVRANTASAGGRGSGGGIYAYEADVTLRDNLVEGNVASTASVGYGGGLRLFKSDAVLGGNTIRDNVASTASLGLGGGLSLWYTRAALEGDSIIDNAATPGFSRLSLGGGIDIFRSAPVTMTNTMIAQNRASTRGSGLHIEGAMEEPALGRVLHTTVADNVGDGPAIFVGEAATLALTNTIIAGHQGAGVYAVMGSTVTLEATLWWDNGLNTDGGGAISTGTISITDDPAFVHPAVRDYHLTPWSAAIDMGVDAGVTQDIDGDARPAAGGYDIGADEYIRYTDTLLYLPLMFR